MPKPRVTMDLSTYHELWEKYSWSNDCCDDHRKVTNIPLSIPPVGAGLEAEEEEIELPAGPALISDNESIESATLRRPLAGTSAGNTAFSPHRARLPADVPGASNQQWSSQLLYKLTASGRPWKLLKTSLFCPAGPGGRGPLNNFALCVHFHCAISAIYQFTQCHSLAIFMWRYALDYYLFLWRLYHVTLCSWLLLIFVAPISFCAKCSLFLLLNEPPLYFCRPLFWILCNVNFLVFQIHYISKQYFPISTAKYSNLRNT